MSSEQRRPVWGFGGLSFGPISGLGCHLQGSWGNCNGFQLPSVTGAKMMVHREWWQIPACGGRMLQPGARYELFASGLPRKATAFQPLWSSPATAAALFDPRRIHWLHHPFQALTCRGGFHLNRDVSPLSDALAAVLLNQIKAGRIRSTRAQEKSESCSLKIEHQRIVAL